MDDSAVEQLLCPPVKRDEVEDTMEVMAFEVVRKGGRK